MNKIAIFVEGQTERIFVIEFLKELLGGEHKFSRIEEKFTNQNRSELIATRIFPNAEFFILIFDASGDGNVLPALFDRSENMIKNQDFKCLIAMQDLYDRPRNKKSIIIRKFNEHKRVFDFSERLKFVLAIMEIEAWFLADYRLFEKLYPPANPNFLKEKLDIDLVEKNPELYKHPSEIINKIFQLFDRKYQKTETQAYKIISNLDFDFLYSDKVLQQVKSLKYFVDCIEKALFDDIDNDLK
ncbi:MAG: DUF4276 family protein [Candidatus Cloacimonetes bacterium]|nr:DUF4276 family protein [Candidatus Cloacimonadota bacterium]